VDGKLDVAGFSLLLQRLKSRRRRGIGIGKRRDPARARNHLDQNFLPFAVKLSRENADAGSIAFRPRHRSDHALTDHVVGDGENRHRRSGFLCGARHHCSAGRNHIERALHELCRIIGNQVEMRGPGAVFDDKILPFNETVSAQLVHQRIHDANGLAGFPRKGEHHAETVGAAGILRVRRDGPRRCRAAEQCDELAPPH
jgi:hypothetical protein